MNKLSRLHIIIHLFVFYYYYYLGVISGIMYLFEKSYPLKWEAAIRLYGRVTDNKP